MIRNINNVWLNRRVIGFAHQGGAKEAPSSTLMAMHQAVRAGIDALELDVHCTKDKKLVVCHDPTVDATTNATGAISEMTLSELKDLDNAYWFVKGEVTSKSHSEKDYIFRGKAPKDPLFGIASLEEVLQSFPDVFINLDIKKTAPEVPSYEGLLAELLRTYRRDDNVIVASFYDAALESFRSQSLGVGTSAGTLEITSFFHFVHGGKNLEKINYQALQVPMSFQGLTIVDEKFVNTAHELGLAVHVWTIDEETQMRNLIELGVDGIISDRPSLLVKVLDSLGLRWNR